jgi:hypothetical protein
MQKRFPQIKRYGLEGAEAMLVALDQLFSEANHGMNITKHITTIILLINYILYQRGSGKPLFVWLIEVVLIYLLTC